MDVRRPAGGKHHAVGSDVTAIRKLGRIMLTQILDRGNGATGNNPDSALLQLCAHVRAHLVVKTTQDILATVHDRHFRTETGKNGGKFEGYIATALNHDTPRKFGEMKRLVRGDGMLDSRNFVAVARRSSGGDQDIRGADAVAVSQLHGIGV